MLLTQLSRFWRNFNMNHIEVFKCEYSDDIEKTVNDYCNKNMLNPISVNVCLEHSFYPQFIVTVVVEPM